jgi:hypothetical protein
VPPTIPTLVGGAPRLVSSGTAALIVDDDGFQTLDIDTAIFNIDVTGSQTADPNDNLIGAGIHALSSVLSTTNAPLVFGFFGTPDNDTNLPDLVITPFAGGVGGFVYARWDIGEGNGTTLADQWDNILGGHAYIEFDTAQFPNGEIRGMIPEPTATSLLVAAVFACMRGRRWR